MAVGGRVEGGARFNADRVSVWEDQRVPEMDGGGVCSTARIRLVPLNRALKNGCEGKLRVICILPQLKQQTNKPQHPSYSSHSPPGARLPPAQRRPDTAAWPQPPSSQGPTASRTSVRGWPWRSNSCFSLPFQPVGSGPSFSQTPRGADSLMRSPPKHQVPQTLKLLPVCFA